MKLQKVYNAGGDISSETRYNPKKVEDEIYNLWLRSGFFNPDRLPEKRGKTYSISIPPPNITGSLHMGHALNTTLQDLLIRFKRLKGFKTLWVPGTDHAGIATQVRVEKELREKGKTRFGLGRKKFLKRVWQWREKYGDIILEQLKKLGVSCDWSRTRFTMDEKYCQAVEKAFLHYYKEGWIYRGKKVVNWCPRCQTSLSDLELEYTEKKGKFWYIRYPLKKQDYNPPKGGNSRDARSSRVPTALPPEAGPSGNKKQEYITVATTRPETMLGDTAVAVNPKDKRYQNLIDKKVILPLVNREIPIIGDLLVDQKFGTGAVKVTPAHDKTDYEIGLKHKLKIIQVIDKNGKIDKKAPPPYRGLSTLEAREKIVKDLRRKGVLEKTGDYVHQIPQCYRCQTIIELIPSRQWFLKMDKLAKLALKAVKTGKIRFIPKNFEKIYFDWLKNIKDWCISRQIWWGHKIPLEGETDVLDTWFSSAFWPFAILGWPRLRPSGFGGQAAKKKSDLKRFYPNDVLSTDRGIINLWVARMIFSGIEFMKEIPFKTVFIHATVLTKKGKRMSKSLGTGVDPINLIERYGADATRFGIVYQSMGGQDIRFVEDNIVMGRKFCNKIWNASRFVLENIGGGREQFSAKTEFSKAAMKSLTLADKKILKTLDRTIKLVTKDLENFRFGQAAHKLYDFFWHDFCDIYIEKSKKQLADNLNGRKKYQPTLVLLLYVLWRSLILLHPFVPFITEEIYQRLPKKNKKKCLMVEKWPKI